jgi:hypothetical protein
LGQTQSSENNLQSLDRKAYTPVRIKSIEHELTSLIRVQDALCDQITDLMEAPYCKVDPTRVAHLSLLVKGLQLVQTRRQAEYRLGFMLEERRINRAIKLKRLAVESERLESVKLENERRKATIELQQARVDRQLAREDREEERKVESYETRLEMLDREKRQLEEIRDRRDSREASRADQREGRAVSREVRAEIRFQESREKARKARQPGNRHLAEAISQALIVPDYEDNGDPGIQGRSDQNGRISLVRGEKRFPSSDPGDEEDRDIRVEDLRDDEAPESDPGPDQVEAGNDDGVDDPDDRGDEAHRGLPS